MIPKTVHYFWLGGNKKSILTNICINSWYEKLNDYNIIEWNEENLDIDKLCKESRFFHECYKRKLWAFMVDYLRLKVLYEYGGIYMDTDVQIIKNLDDLLDQKAFIGEEIGNYIGTGLIASEPKNKKIKRILEFYDTEIWKTEMFTIPHIITYIFEKEGAEEFKVYPMEYFAPYDYRNEFSYSSITKNTYSIHWFSGSWTGNMKARIFMGTKHIDNKFVKNIMVAKKTIGFYLGKLKLSNKK